MQRESRGASADTTAATRRKNRPGGLLVAFCLMAIMLAALFFRAHGLERQSVWFDEYNSLAHLEQPTLSAFFAAQEEKNDTTMPLYFFLEYYWARLFGSGPVAVRWFSVLLGCFTIPAMFLLGRRLHSERAGLLAAAMLAASPSHIYHAQGVRPYALFALVSILSMYTFVSMLQTGRRRWWLLQVLANAALFWTHIVGVFLLAAQALFLLFCWRKNLARVIVWGLAQAAALSSALAFVALVWPNRESVSVGLRASQLPIMLFAQDTRQVEWGMEHVNVAELTALPHFLGMAFPAMSTLLFLVLGVLFCFACFRALRRPGNARFAVGLCAICLVVPVFLLYAAALARSESLFQARYILYSSMALHLAVAMAVFSINRPLLRKLLVVALLGLYGAHAVLALSIPLRTNYLEAAHLVRQGADNGEVIVYPPLIRDTFAYNLGKDAPPLKAAQSVPDLLAELKAAVAGGGRARMVLAEIDSSRTVALSFLEQCMELLGLDCRLRTVPGPNVLYVFFCERRQGADGAGGRSGEAQFASDVEQFAGSAAFARTLARAGDFGAAETAYARAIRAIPRTPAGQAEFAEALANLAWRGTRSVLLDLQRDAVAVYGGRADVLFQLGRPDAAVESACAGANLFPEYAPAYLACADAMLRADRIPEALAMARQMTERFPQSQEVWSMLARAHHRDGDVTAALLAYRRAVELSAGDPQPYTELGGILVESGQYAEAVAVLQRGLALREDRGDPAPMTRLWLMEALCESGAGEQARAHLRRCDELRIHVPPELRIQVEAGCEREI